MSIEHCFVLMFTLAATELAVADCNNAIPKTTPDNAFALHNDGTVTHNKTGLMWMRCELGQTWDGTTCGGSGQPYSWQSALQAAEGYAFAGYSDWRLPNKNELASIVEQACYYPAINTLVFTNVTSSYVWSSSPYANYSGNAWSVGSAFGDVAGYNVGDYNYNHVRLVRGGQ